MTRKSRKVRICITLLGSLASIDILCYKAVAPKPLKVEEAKKPQPQAAVHHPEPSSSIKPVKAEKVESKAKPTVEKAAPSTRKSKAAPEQGKYFNPQDSFASSGGEEEPVAEHAKAKSALKTKAKPATTKSDSSTQSPASTSQTGHSGHLDQARRPAYSVIINKHMKNPLEQALTIGLSLLIGLWCIFWCLERHRVGYCDVAHDDQVNGTKGNDCLQIYSVFAYIRIRKANLILK